AEDTAGRRGPGNADGRCPSDGAARRRLRGLTQQVAVAELHRGQSGRHVRTEHSGRRTVRPEEDRAMSEQMPEDLQHFQKDFEKAEKKVAGEIDPGKRSVGIAVMILLLLASFLLPHTGSVNGWDVISSDGASHEEAVAITSKLFVWFALVFGAFTGIITLVTRRWFLAWVSAAGCAVGVFLGVMAIWSRQTPSGVLDGKDAALANLS